MSKINSDEYKNNCFVVIWINNHKPLKPPLFSYNLKNIVIHLIPILIVEFNSLVCVIEEWQQASSRSLQIPSSVLPSPITLIRENSFHVLLDFTSGVCLFQICTPSSPLISIYLLHNFAVYILQSHLFPQYLHSSVTCLFIRTSFFITRLLYFKLFLSSYVKKHIHLSHVCLHAYVCA